MKHVVFNHGNAVPQNPIQMKDVPIGGTFGKLSYDWLGPTRSHYDQPSVKLEKGEEFCYKVVLETCIRTEHGYVGSLGGQEQPLKPDLVILL